MAIPSALPFAPDFSQPEGTYLRADRALSCSPPEPRIDQPFLGLPVGIPAVTLGPGS